MTRHIGQETDSVLSVRNYMLPGDMGYIVHLHGMLYAAEYGFDNTFEPYVAIPLSEFVRSESTRERIWVVERAGLVRGSVAIVEHSDAASQLRWLLLHPEVRGAGMGKRLVDEAVSFCRAQGYQSVFLWTVKGLDAAAALYREKGFYLTESKTHDLWGRTLTEERYELPL